MKPLRDERGSISYLLLNPYETFIKGRGWMHILLGISLLMFGLSFFLTEDFLPNASYSASDFIAFYFFFPLGLFVIAGFLGFVIEDRQWKWFGATFDYNDLWWTALAFLPVALLYHVIPDSWHVAQRWISAVIFILLVWHWFRLNKIKVFK